MDLFSTKIKTISGIDDERLEENPLRFLEKLNENSDYLTELQNLLESFNYHNLDKETKLKHERRLAASLRKNYLTVLALQIKLIFANLFVILWRKMLRNMGNFFIQR